MALNEWERVPIADQYHRFILEVNGLVPMSTVGDWATKAVASRDIRPFPFVQDSGGTDEDITHCSFGFAGLAIYGRNCPSGCIFVPFTPVDLMGELDMSLQVVLCAKVFEIA